MDHEIRKTGISGTDIAAICGVNPHKTAFRVWEEKTGKAEPIEQTRQMKWGHILEPVVATQFRLAHPEFAKRMKMNKTTFVNPDNALVVGTPDYLLPPEEGLEVKAHSYFAAARLGFGEQGTDDVPKHHYLQCEWYMILMDVYRWHLAVLIDTSDYREYQIERKPALDEKLLDIAARFWDKHVKADEPPPLDGSKDVANYLKRTFPTHTDMLPVATDEQTAIYDEYWHHRRARDLAVAEMDRLENVLKFHVGDTAGLVFKNGKLTWKRCKDGSKTDWKAVAIAAGATTEQIAEYTTARPGVRRFLAKLTEQEG